tara:strand:+ start:2540 stop:2977 length:438 start_codon:yes stop_codon:yes gene_type:complete
MSMPKPKLIEDITIDDLKEHRWCYYQNDEEDYDAFEYVIPDTHSEFSEEVIELELAEFRFSNGAITYGIYDGSEAFNIVTKDQWYSFWYGVIRPDAKETERLANYLESSGFELPVEACAKWSNTTKTFNGIQFLNDNGEIVEVTI